MVKKMKQKETNGLEPKKQMAEVSDGSHLTWDEYFMSLAKLVSLRSKDPRMKAGAVIIDPIEKTVISTGYNGFPRGCPDSMFPWEKGDDLDPYDTKFPYVVHAELNAILASETKLRGKRMYVTHSPCNECMKAIIQSGIREIVYQKEYDMHELSYRTSMRMATSAGVSIWKYKDNGKKVTIESV